MKKIITIGNNGPEITETNYWDLEHAKEGFFYLSWNSGAARLLVPDSMHNHIDEMRTGELVIVSRGKYQGRDAYELLFEDYGNSPYALHLLGEQSDCLLTKQDHGADIVVSVWARLGKQLELPGKFRFVDNLPYMQPWSVS